MSNGSVSPMFLISEQFSDGSDSETTNSPPTTPVSKKPKLVCPPAPRKQRVSLTPEDKLERQRTWQDKQIGFFNNCCRPCIFEKCGDFPLATLSYGNLTSKRVRCKLCNTWMSPKNETKEIGVGDDDIIINFEGYESTETIGGLGLAKGFRGSIW